MTIIYMEFPNEKRDALNESEPIFSRYSLCIGIAQSEGYTNTLRKCFPQCIRLVKWLTEAVLIEIANALASSNRSAAVAFISSCYITPNVRVVSVDSKLLKRAMSLYQNRGDKEWGLTDCISFIAMDDNDLTDAFTADDHFQQAGFRAL